jgi:hypothetical protein
MTFTVWRRHYQDILGGRSTTGQFGGREWGRISRDLGEAENSLQSY